jgi:carbon monoxide dehydrogenase subunit G
MQLKYSFTVPATVEQAWELLLDIERVVPSLPGASLESFDGDTFTGTVRVKLGAIQMTYRGQGRFTQRDAANRRVEMEASGKDAKGAGTVGATIVCGLTEDGDRTRVDVSTELTVTGRPAQFGRGLLNDVGAKVFDQFALNLSGALQARPEQAGPISAATEPSAEQTSALEQAPSVLATGTPASAEALDLMSVAGGAVAKRIALGAAALAAVAVLVFVASRLLS